MWQQCPVCKNNHYPTPCRVCNGTQLISELTGRPPQTITTNTTTINNGVISDNNLCKCMNSQVTFINGKYLCSTCQKYTT